MHNISVTIITKNEEHNIERCLKSVQWADEIVVVDSGSTDKTLAICRQYPCKILESEWLGFGRTKKFAVNAATNDWIFSIDADEEVTTSLKEKILAIMNKPQHHGYRIKRQSFYLHKLIRYSGWQRDYQLRLFDRRQGNFNEKTIHESVTVSGSVGKIDEPLLHYTYPTIQAHVQRMNLYSELGAARLQEQGRSSSIAMAVMHGLAKFLKMYFLYKGFMDGRIGFVLAYNSAYGVFLKYLKLWERKR